MRPIRLCTQNIPQEWFISIFGKWYWHDEQQLAFLGHAEHWKSFVHEKLAGRRVGSHQHGFNRLPKAHRQHQKPGKVLHVTGVACNARSMAARQNVGCHNVDTEYHLGKRQLAMFTYTSRTEHKARLHFLEQPIVQTRAVFLQAIRPLV
jgi:hypothetical protein